MSLVAERAGVGKGTLYEYFQSKEDLFSNLVVAVLRESLETLSSHDQPDAPPPQALRGAISYIVRVALDENLDLYRLFYDFWGVSQRHRLQAQRKLRECEEAFREFLVDLVRRGQESGHLRAELDPDLWVTGLMAAVDGISIKLIILGQAVDLTAYTRLLHSVFVDGALAAGRLDGASIIKED